VWHRAVDRAGNREVSPVPRTLNTTNITYGLCGFYPDGGMISFSGSGGSSGDITLFDTCMYSGNWNNGAGSSGTFSGSFI